MGVFGKLRSLLFSRKTPAEKDKVSSETSDKWVYFLAALMLTVIVVPRHGL